MTSLSSLLTSDLTTALSLSLSVPVELDAEHAQRVPGAEQGGLPAAQVKLKERQKFFEEAFQQDMEQYLSTGYLQIAERRGEEEEERPRLSSLFLFSFSQKEKCRGIQTAASAAASSRVNAKLSGIQMN